MKKNKLKKTNRLTPLEKKYCRCLIYVRSKKNSPYGICTSSVYNKQKKKRTKTVKCGDIYNFKQFSLEELKLYAKEKKIKITNKKGYLSKKKIIDNIRRKSIKKYKK